MKSVDFGRLSEELVCSMPGLIGGSTEKKSRARRRAEPSQVGRVTHTATRMACDE